MKKFMRKHIDLASEIVQNIINEAKVDASGVSWETIYRCLNKGQFDRQTRYGLDYGNAGIVLFLLKYYEKTQDQRVLPLITKGVSKTINHFSYAQSPIGFYSGRGGVIYLLIEAYRILQQQEYLDKAAQLAILPFDDAKTTNVENGLAGFLLGILQLVQADPQHKWMEVVQDICYKITANAKVSQDGVYWDELPVGMYPISGFLYGNSGIVFALKEAAPLFTDPSFFDNLIEEALHFEDARFNHDIDNWPDFVNEDQLIYHMKNYTAVNKLKTISDKYFKPGKSFWWSIGAPGALLPRRGNSKPIYQRSYQKAIRVFQSIVEKPSTDFGLLRGAGGVAMALAYLGHSLPANTIVNSLTRQKDRYQDFLSSYPNNPDVVDLSLFRGEAGIGYFLLCLEDNACTQPSVLFPFVNLTAEQSMKIAAFDADTLVLQSNYRSDSYQKKKQKSYYEHISELINQNVPHDLTDESILRRELFNLRQKISNSHFDTIKFLRLKSFHPDELPKKLTLSNACKVLELKENAVILKRSFGFVQPIAIDDVKLAIYKVCNRKSGVQYKEIEEEIIRLTDVQAEDEKQFIKERILEEVCQSFADGVLEEVD
jgi:hypothetical protein